MSFIKRLFGIGHDESSNQSNEPARVRRYEQPIGPPDLRDQFIGPTPAPAGYQYQPEKTVSMHGPTSDLYCGLR